MASDIDATAFDAAPVRTVNPSDVESARKLSFWENRFHGASGQCELLEALCEFRASVDMKEVYFIDLLPDAVADGRWQGWRIGDGSVEIPPSIFSYASTLMASSGLPQCVDLAQLSWARPADRALAALTRVLNHSGIECLTVSRVVEHDRPAFLLLSTYSESLNAPVYQSHAAILAVAARRRSALLNADPTTSRRAVLTNRERECLSLSSQGYSEKQVAKVLEISPFTVRVHIENIKKKLRARNKIHAILLALSTGQIDELNELSESATCSIRNDVARQRKSETTDLINWIVNCTSRNHNFRNRCHPKAISFRYRIDLECIVEIGRLG